MAVNVCAKFCGDRLCINKAFSKLTAQELKTDSTRTTTTEAAIWDPKQKFFTSCISVKSTFSISNVHSTYVSLLWMSRHCYL